MSMVEDKGEEQNGPHGFIPDFWSLPEPAWWKSFLWGSVLAEGLLRRDGRKNKRGGKGMARQEDMQGPVVSVS